MAVLKCKMCGGSIRFAEGETIGVCDSCGTRQTLSEPKNVRNIKGSISEKKERKADKKVDALMARASMFLQEEDWDSADEYFDRVLDNQPHNAMAWWGKGLAYNQLVSTSDLIESCEKAIGLLEKLGCETSDPWELDLEAHEKGIRNSGFISDIINEFDEDGDYYKAIKFSDENQRKEWEKAREIIISRIEGFIASAKPQNKRIADDCIGIIDNIEWRDFSAQKKELERMLNLLEKKEAKVKELEKEIDEKRERLSKKERELGEWLQRQEFEDMASKSSGKVTGIPAEAIKIGCIIGFVGGMMLWGILLAFFGEAFDNTFLCLFITLISMGISIWLLSIRFWNKEKANKEHTLYTIDTLQKQINSMQLEMKESERNLTTFKTSLVEACENKATSTLCPTCGKQIVHGSSFCGGCGRKL